MPKILTDAYKDATFFIPYSEDKREGVYAKPLTDSEINRITIDAAKEGGADQDRAKRFFIKNFLQKSLTGWDGFYDVSGKDIPFGPDAIKEICECDPEFTAGLVLRLRNIARVGELEDRKN